MEITVNGETKNIAEQQTLRQLIIDLGLENRRIAIEVNQELITRGEFDAHQLNSGDIVEIVQAIGGG